MLVEKDQNVQPDEILFECEANMAAADDEDEATDHVSGAARKGGSFCNFEIQDSSIESQKRVTPFMWHPKIVGRPNDYD